MRVGLDPCLWREQWLQHVVKRSRATVHPFGESDDAGHSERVHSVQPHTAGPSRPVESEGLRQLRVKQESKLVAETPVASYSAAVV